MIVANIIGGLGNQMFQYAAARRAALKAGCPLGLDLTSMANYRAHAYGLDQFVLAEGLVPDVDGPSFARGKGIFGRLRRALRGECNVNEKAFVFDPAILDLASPARMVGYWQSERYFVDVADRIRADFALVRPMTAHRRAVFDAIEGSESVSVHVRRGDYVTNPAAAAFHGTCSLDWYERSVAVAAEGMSAPRFFVFSDDPDWARANLRLPGAAEFVERSADRRDAEDMHLMAACRAHVIANSTFSWWAAWLDPRPDVRVVAPRRWFAGGDLDTRDLIPDRWIRV
ncbi:MAG: alpha-1,2-fucosyltransferase [Hyphomicrobiales bacterium]|nr:alpha-1,2-fucosyltransferase [Hyphomicrobiales bacterium]